MIISIKSQPYDLLEINNFPISLTTDLTISYVIECFNHCSKNTDKSRSKIPESKKYLTYLCLFFGDNGCTKNKGPILLYQKFLSNLNIYIHTGIMVVFYYLYLYFEMQFYQVICFITQIQYVQYTTFMGSCKKPTILSLGFGATAWPFLYQITQFRESIWFFLFTA